MRTFYGIGKRIAAAVTALIVTLTSFCFSAAAETGTNNIVTATTAVNLRSAASTSSTVYSVVPKGAELTLLDDSENGWAHVSFGAQTGYVSTTYLDLPDDSEVNVCAVTTTALNLREGKGSSYSIVLTLPKGAELQITDNSDDNWAGIKYKTSSGYVSKDYIIIDFTLPEETVYIDNTVYAHRTVSFSGLPSGGVSDTADPEDCFRLIPSATALSLDINGTYTLTVMDESSRPVAGGLKFVSSDSKTVSVTSKGVLKGLKSGKATITVSDDSGSLKAECAVTVTNSTAKATQPPTQAPTQKPTAALNTGGLKLSATSASVYKGCYYQLKAASASAVSWSSSNTSVASVSSEGIVTAISEGTATITAKSSSGSATCKLTVVKGSAVSLSAYSAKISAGKTYLARSYTSDVAWSSSDTSVATVNNGYILAQKAGKAVITVSTSGGASTMLITVSAAEPVRFAYTSPNCAAKDESVSLIAITDTSRTAVRFKVYTGSTSTIVNAGDPVADGNTLVWTATTSFKTAGQYNVEAYSQLNGTWSGCEDGRTTAFVADSSDSTTTVCTQRRASDGVISLIANFEGYISSIYNDPITGDPTVGYGRVIYAGQQFYNTMTKNEAFAYLVQTVNNEGYASKVNSFLINNKVKFNQQQFDALVSLVYNTGAGVLTGSTDLRSALLDCYDGSKGTVSYYINGSSVRIRKGAGTNYDIIKELGYNTPLTILSTEISAWYRVRLSDGTEGYVSSDYISKRATGGVLDLNYVDKRKLIDKFCQYHHAGGGCVYGLLYRRVDEMEMFFYGDYDRNYGVYKYDISYTCAFNSSFHT